MLLKLADTRIVQPRERHWVKMPFIVVSNVDTVANDRYVLIRLSTYFTRLGTDNFTESRDIGATI